MTEWSSESFEAAVRQAEKSLSEAGVPVGSALDIGGRMVASGHNRRVQDGDPIAHGEMLKNTDVAAMADKYGVSIPQLCIRYTLQLGVVSLPKTANPDHMRANAEVDFEISDEDMTARRDLRARDYGEHSGFPVFSGK